MNTLTFSIGNDNINYPATKCNTTKVQHNINQMHSMHSARHKKCTKQKHKNNESLLLLNDMRFLSQVLLLKWKFKSQHVMMVFA